MTPNDSLEDFFFAFLARGSVGPEVLVTSGEMFRPGGRHYYGSIQLEMRLPLDHLGLPSLLNQQAKKGGGCHFYELNIYVTPRSTGKSHSVSVWGGEAFRWGHEGGAPGWISVLTRRSVWRPFSVSVSLLRSLSHVRNTARRQPSVSQEDSSHQNPAILTPWSQSSSPRTVRNKCLLCKPLRLTWLQQPSSDSPVNDVITKGKMALLLSGGKRNPTTQGRYILVCPCPKDSVNGKVRQSNNDRTAKNSGLIGIKFWVWSGNSYMRGTAKHIVDITENEIRMKRKKIKR